MTFVVIIMYASNRCPSRLCLNIYSESKDESKKQYLILQGDFFDWSRPKSSKCWRWQNPYQKSESKGVSHRTYENLTQTFTFLVGFLPSPTLRTFRVGPFEKKTL